MAVPRLMLATNNASKVAEFRSLLAAFPDLAGIELLTPSDWANPLPTVEETGETFEENARLKAVALAQATGLPALADDSGLCVRALGGAPGIHSARWAGVNADDTQRNEKLLAVMAGVPALDRSAYFACVIALALPGGATHAAEGICEGVVLEAPRGSDGFGYDPLFLLPDLGRSFAELTADEKNSRSHRSLAVSALMPILRRTLLP